LDTRPSGNIKAQAESLHRGKFRMFREEKTSTLPEKIDDAIEQAENLGLALVASILKIARLELIQPENGRGAGSGRKRDT
jgi:hypothetical protein